MAYVPNMPAAPYDNPWDRSTPIDEAALVAMLPPAEQVTLPVFTVRELTAFRPSRLGHYAPGDLDDPSLAPLINALLADLEAASARVHAENTRRPWPYVSLDPHLALNSTSI